MEYQGVATTAEYPYTSGKNGKTGTCNHDLEKKGKIKLKEWKPIPKEVNQYKAAIKKNVIVNGLCVDKVIQKYKKGVLKVDNNSCFESNHLVATIGYAYNNGSEYYIVRNSWGTKWGEDGYMRIAITGDGVGT